MRWKEIMEGRDAPLYHGTSGFSAARIVAADTILPNSNQHQHAHNGFLRHDELEGEATIMRGVSLTRSLKLAFEFGEIVLVLDQRRLSQTHRIEPLDYWGHSPSIEALGGRRQGKQAEAEEFVIGPVRPLSRFLEAILITPRAHKRFTAMRQGQDDVSMIDALLKHPLLRVWDGR
jgi:hypothetical protein